MRKTSVLGKKLIFSLAITMLYLLGRCIPIPWIQMEKTQSTGSLLAFLSMTYGSTGSTNSVFMLGYLPWMTASVIVQLLQLTSGENRHKVSISGIRKRIMILSFFIAILQAVLQSTRLKYRTDLMMPVAAEQFMTILVMIAGSYAVVWMGDQNAQKSIGGPSLIIMINILDSVHTQLVQSFTDIESQYRNAAIVISVIYIAFAIFLTVLLDRAEIRLYVQQVLIDSDLAQKDYIAIRLNPVGTMPVMYSMAFFAFPLYICEFLQRFFPENHVLQAIIAGLNLNSITGVLIFLVMLVVLTILLSFIYINPKDIAEQMQKTGDYIAGYTPGKETEHIIRRHLLFAGITGGIAVSLCVSIPLIVRVRLQSTNPIFMLSISIIILTGIILQYLDELTSEIDMSHYRKFL